MTLREFIRHLILHATMAACLWYVTVVTAESLIPGFVSPFIDLSGSGLLILLCIVITCLVGFPVLSRWHRYSSIVVCVFVMIGLELFLWARVSDLGNVGLGLILLIGVLSSVFLWTFFEKPDGIE